MSQIWDKEDSTMHWFKHWDIGTIIDLKKGHYIG